MYWKKLCNITIFLPNTEIREHKKHKNLIKNSIYSIKILYLHLV